MERFYFHATDGRSSIVDRVGQEIDSGEVDAFANTVVSRVRDQIGDTVNLSGWFLVLRDDQGVEVYTLPFFDAIEMRETAAA